ncbi:hypothetical protein [Paraburkholderia sp. DGU8]|uniref:hypothetical protein n=1 Tax=Paraburkholderia sp. DGU8 TaxID=3161997 RepID=UPI003467CCD5
MKSSAADDRGLFGNRTVLRHVSSGQEASAAIVSEAPQGRWVGLLKVRETGRERFHAADIDRLLQGFSDLMR